MKTTWGDLEPLCQRQHKPIKQKYLLLECWPYYLVQLPGQFQCTAKFSKQCNLDRNAQLFHIFQLDIITVDCPGSIAFIQFSTGNKTKTELAFFCCVLFLLGVIAMHSQQNKNFHSYLVFWREILMAFFLVANVILFCWMGNCLREEMHCY